MKIMYVRVSTSEQNEARQVELGKKMGVEKYYIDKASGKNLERSESKKMMSFIREGNELIIESFSRIARNTKDLLSIVEELKEKKVSFISLKENIDTGSTSGRFMLTVFGALSQLERETILERQREGIEIARRNGKYLGRKPRSYDEEKFSALVAQYKRGERKATSIMKEFDITATTFYRWIKDIEIEENGQ